MKQQAPSMECAGSLTPELEGARRSAAHTDRTGAKPAPKAQQTGGGKR